MESCVQYLFHDLFERVVFELLSCEEINEITFISIFKCLPFSSLQKIINSLKKNEISLTAIYTYVLLTNEKL
ncbi:Protein of unknown function [Gryllus bimaculatus]|nr:Protein of unknown function [Gryllus bimaculatus]